MDRRDIAPALLLGASANGLVSLCFVTNTWWALPLLTFTTTCYFIILARFLDGGIRQWLRVALISLPSSFVSLATQAIHSSSGDLFFALVVTSGPLWVVGLVLLYYWGSASPPAQLSS